MLFKYRLDEIIPEKASLWVFGLRTEVSGDNFGP